MPLTVVIDCFPESARKYHRSHAIVAIDVIRATTTAVTCVATGRRCFPVASLAAARRLAEKNPGMLLVGELGGDLPPGFDLNNSPAELAARHDTYRPAALVSTSGTRLVCEAAAGAPTYLACFRNYRYTAAKIAWHHPRIAVIGAGSKGQFREEDQMCCAWLADELLQAGYRVEDEATGQIVERWRGVPPSACASGRSAGYLKRSNQLHDLDFVLAHVNDLDALFAWQQGEIVMRTAAFGAQPTVEVPVAA